MQNIGILPRNLSFVAKPFNQEDVTAITLESRVDRNEKWDVLISQEKFSKYFIIVH